MSLRQQPRFLILCMPDKIVCLHIHHGKKTVGQRTSTKPKKRKKPFGKFTPIQPLRPEGPLRFKPSRGKKKGVTKNTKVKRRRYSSGHKSRAVSTPVSVLVTSVVKPQDGVFERWILDLLEQFILEYLGPAVDDAKIAFEAAKEAREVPTSVHARELDCIGAEETHRIYLAELARCEKNERRTLRWHEIKMFVSMLELGEVLDQLDDEDCVLVTEMVTIQK